MATRRQLTQAGLTRRGLEAALAAGALTRTATGLYAAPGRPRRGEHLLSGGTVDPGYLADVREALLRAPAGAAASHLSAAVLHGFDLVVEPADVQLLVPYGCAARPGDGVQTRRRRSLVVVRRRVLAGCTPVCVTDAATTALDAASVLPLAQAVAVVDSALRRRVVTRDELVRHVRDRRGVDDVAHLWQVLRWCDPRSGSVLESLARVLLALAGLAPECTQLVLQDGRVVVGRVDLAWPSARLVVELDGRRWHDPQDARDRDRRRDNAAAVLGWRVLRFCWADVVARPDEVVAAVRACLG